MKNKVFAILAIVIVVGIIIVCTLGYNVDISYKGYHLIDVKIGKECNISDIKSITDEVFKDQYVGIQKVGTYSDSVAIKVYSVSEEQKELLNTKINEKFELENTVEDMNANYVPSYKLRDVIKPYVIPLSAATVLILIYAAIRFRKIGTAKVIYQMVTLTIMAELLYGALIAITRYPVNRLVMPVGVVIYIAVITTLTGIFEKQVQAEKE